MFQYPADHYFFFNKSKYPHDAVAFGAGERIGFVYLLNQPGPVGTAFLAMPCVRFLTENLQRLVVAQSLFSALATGGVAVPAVVPHHLLAMPGNVADYHGKPVECAEGLGRVTVFGAVVDRAALFDVGHPLLGELAADYVVGKFLKRLPVFRSYRLADMDVEAAVMPRHEQVNVPLAYGPLLQQHLQEFVTEELFQCVGVVVGGDVEVAIFVKGSIGYDDVAVGIEAQEVAEGLDGAGAAGYGVACACHVLFQCLPGDSA